MDGEGVCVDAEERVRKTPCQDIGFLSNSGVRSDLSLTGLDWETGRSSRKEGWGGFKTRKQNFRS